MAALSAAPAVSLGEDGPFPLPLETTRIELVPEAVTRLPLAALVRDDAESELELGTARLAVPEGTPPKQAELIRLAADGRSAEVAGQGTWSILGRDLVFTPLGGRTDTPPPIGLTIGSIHGTISQPARIEVTTLPLAEASVRVSAGAKARISLPAPAAKGARTRLQLDGQSAGATLTSDGSRMVVPEQGTWRVLDGGSALELTPSAARPEMQPDSVRYVVEDAEGRPIGAGRARVTVPIISDIYRSAPYGDPITLAVGQAQQNVDPATLRLRPPLGESGAEVAADGSSAVVPGQGTWRVDRKRATVTFTPESAKVRIAAPMTVLGGDGHGAAAAPALLSTAYPVLVDRVGVAAPGTDVVLDLAQGALDVRPESFAFDPEAIPEGARISADGLTVSVPGQGVWTIDREARTATFRPVKALRGSADPVGVTARGVYADNQVSATFTARFSRILPTMRDDELRTAPATPVTLDPLANDTAGSAARPLNASTLRIRSLSATNLDELEQGLGRRLVIPGEGTYVVGDGGAVTFTPVAGFVGPATPIDYVVEDDQGVPASAAIGAEVDPDLAGSGGGGSSTATGMTSLLVGILPARSSTALVFDAIVALMLFSGSIALWIGTRMEADRRDWDD